MNPETVHPPEEKKPSLLPVLLSALLLPGAGQLVQKRWIPAILFASTFLLFMAAVLKTANAYLSAAFNVAMEFNSSASPETPDLAILILPLGFGFVIYLLNLADVMFAHIRSCQAWAERKLQNKLKKLVSLSLLLLAFLPGADICMANDMILSIRNDDFVALNNLIDQDGPERIHAPILTGGVTPLHLAAALNRTSIAGLLLARGAKPEVRTDSGFTPLHWAAGKDAGDTARLLIRFGADVNAVTDAGITPLHWAARANATNVVTLLLNAGADFTRKTTLGLMPLHWAVQKDSSEASIMLAYASVSAETEAEMAADPVFPPDEEPGLSAGDTLATNPPPAAVDPLAAPLPETFAFGTFLAVPLGLGEVLSFVWIDSLKIWAGRYEISNGQYKRMDVRHKSLFREGFSLDGKDQPVVYVTWKDANAYCAWLNQNHSDKLPKGFIFRLPTDREWTALARCGDNRRYPWGDQWPPSYGNFSDLATRKAFDNWTGIRGYNDGFPVTCSVYESGVNEWNIYGLAGNVWEWCEDWYDSTRTHKIRQGGSWDFDKEPELRVDRRGFDRPDTSDDNIGFRVIVALKP